jgi:ABC-type phosphate/phosphonate transport system substrate-binding protein
LGRDHGENNAPASANDTDLLIAIVMARPDIKSVSDLIGKKIAIDSRHSMSNRNVRTAIVAAGAPGIQLSEGQTTAINQLVNGEVPAAVLALVSADAADGFPEIVGFKIFQIPLSPRSVKDRP